MNRQSGPLRQYCGVQISGEQNWTLSVWPFVCLCWRRQRDFRVQDSPFPMEVIYRLLLRETTSASGCTWLVCCAEAISNHLSSMLEQMTSNWTWSEEGEVEIHLVCWKENRKMVGWRGWGSYLELPNVNMHAPKGSASLPQSWLSPVASSAANWGLGPKLIICKLDTLVI